MNPTAYLKLLLLTIFADDVISSKILTILTVPAKSHYLWYTKYVDGLLRRGHSVTYFGVERMKSSHPNLRQLVSENLQRDLFSNDYMIENIEAGPVETTLLYDKWEQTIAEYLKKDEAFRMFLNVVKTEKFDLIVNDLTLTFFLLGAAGIHKDVPVMALTPFGQPSWSMDILNSPILYPSHPHHYLPFGQEMTFFERLGNFLFHAFYWGTRTLFMIEQNKHAKDAFGEDIDSLEKITERINIIMVNSIEGVDFPSPRVPGLIPIGGFHIDPPKELPKDILSYLDNATHGAIYFSLGTTVKISSLEKGKLEEIMKAFKQLSPVRVLMKWERDDPPPIPDNVKTLKWAPQNDILAHSKILAFFTHSGLLSTQEAIYHGVPLIGMPFLLDQHSNLRKCMEQGIAEDLDYLYLTSDAIVEKIRKLIDVPKYREKVKRLSVIARDKMNTPRETALFWTEYAIRHKGAPHLSLLSRKMAWYENSQLDVYLFLLLLVAYVAFVAYKLLKFLARKLRKDQIKPKTN